VWIFWLSSIMLILLLVIVSSSCVFYTSQRIGCEDPLRMTCRLIMCRAGWCTERVYASYTPGEKSACGIISCCFKVRRLICEQMGPSQAPCGCKLYAEGVAGSPSPNLNPGTRAPHDVLHWVSCVNCEQTFTVIKFVHRHQSGTILYCCVMLYHTVLLYSDYLHWQFCFCFGFCYSGGGVPRRQSHNRSGLATLPSVGAIPESPHISVDRGICCILCLYVCLLYLCVIDVLFVFLQYFDTVGFVFIPCNKKA